MVSLASLLVQHTKAFIYAKALEVATTVGLPVDTWRTGDPTRSLYHLLSEILETVEQVVAGYVASGFLDYAAANPAYYPWLVLLAKQVYNYDATEATYATTTVTLTNGGGGYYELAAGDVTVKASSTGKTYHSTSGGILASGPGTTLDIDVEADEAGSESSASASDIDTMVTNLLGVTCSNATSAVGLDAESAESIVTGCRAKLGSLSPNGPADAYNFVATSSALTGTTGITKSRTYGDSDTGDVTVYLAGPSGGVSGGDRSSAEEAILAWALPQCITPTVASASNNTIAVTYELWIYDSVGETNADIEDAIEASLVRMFASRPIGGDVITGSSGYLYKSLVESTIRSVYPNHAFRVSVTAPAADVSIATNEVAVLGTVTATAIHQESTP